jgi:hypothetical protein
MQASTATHTPVLNNFITLVSDETERIVSQNEDQIKIKGLRNIAMRVEGTELMTVQEFPS